MAKNKVLYVCDKCGYESPKWFGKCPVCGEWNSAKEMRISGETEERLEKAGERSRFFPLSEIERDIDTKERHKLDIPALDNLLNGGFVKGQITLLGGEPGIGKSTIALQISDNIIKNDDEIVYYVSGEENVAQVALRAKRLNLKNSKNIHITSENEIENVFQNIDLSKAKFLIVDSIQTVSSVSADSPVGGVVQIRLVVEKIRRFCKKNKIPALLIAHVTKEGTIAGPKLVEHVVDTVIYFEGERSTDFRILRVQKNRYGPSGEFSVFQMGDAGLVPVPEDLFLSHSQEPGNVLTSVFEGVRPVNVQIQALVSRVKSAVGRRISHGVDVRKVMLISAVLSKHLNLPLDFHDIYINVSGGLNIEDPASDLALAGAILSSFLDVYIGDTYMIGEIGLDGSVKSVLNISKRIENTKLLPIKKIVIPEVSDYKPKDSEKIVKIKNVKDLFKYIISQKNSQEGKEDGKNQDLGR